MSHDRVSVKGSATMVTMVHRGWRLPHKASESNSNSPNIAMKVSRESVGDSDTEKWKDQGPLGSGRGPFVIAPTTQQSKHRFEFINTTGDHRMNDKGLRKLVRSHAAQERKLRPKQRRGKKGRSDPPLTTSFTQISQESAEPASSNLYRTSASHYSNLGSDQQLQAAYGPLWSLQVLRYFVEVSRAMYPRQTAFKLNPINPDGFFQRALSDQAMTHSLLYISVTYFGLLNGEESLREASFQMTNAVRLVNKRMEDPVQAIADSTINTIAILACAEYIRGNFQQWILHMNGLQTIANLRGGIDSLDRLTRLKLLRCDIGGSVENLHNPYFSFQRQGSARLYTGKSSYEGLENRPAAAMIYSGLDPLLIKLYQDLGTFSMVIDQVLRSDQTSLNLVEFCEECISIQQGFLCFFSSTSEPEQRLTEDALRVGALLYLKAVLKELPSSVTGSRILIAELKNCLGGKLNPRKQEPVLLWLCFIGCSGSQVESDRRWFMAHLIDLAIILELTDWDNARNVLKKILWIGAIHEVSFGDIWDRSTAIRRGSADQVAVQRLSTLL